MSVSPQQRNLLVYLNSKYGSKNNSTYVSDVNFLLSSAIQKPIDTILCVKVQQFIYPVSFYNVNSTNNLINYEVDGGLETQIALAEGIYTASSFMDEFNDKLGDDGFSVSYDEEAMKYMFSHDSSSFTFYHIGSTCFSLLGLIEGVDHDSSSDSGVYLLISEYPVDLSPTKSVYVSIPNLSINNLNGNTGQRTPVIASVPVNEEAGDVMVYTNDTGLASFTQEETISEFHIKILDEDLSALINFQNLIGK